MEQLQLLPWDLAGRLVVAMFLGGLIGFERESKDQEAGLRTNMLVSMGACLFSILSFAGYDTSQPGADPTRIAAQIASGIGFLGAATVFRDRNRIRGLTTAAGIWLVAAVGMAAGAGQIFIATAATLLALLVLVVLQPFENFLRRISPSAKPCSDDPSHPADLEEDEQKRTVRTDF